MEDERVPVLQQAMEYAGSMGTMLLDEVAYVNGQTESGMGRAMNGIDTGGRGGNTQQAN